MLKTRTVTVIKAGILTLQNTGKRRVTLAQTSLPLKQHLLWGQHHGLPVTWRPAPWAGLHGPWQAAPSQGNRVTLVTGLEGLFL